MEKSDASPAVDKSVFLRIAQEAPSPEDRLFMKVSCIDCEKYPPGKYATYPQVTYHPLSDEHDPTMYPFVLMPTERALQKFSLDELASSCDIMLMDKSTGEKITFEKKPVFDCSCCGNLYGVSGVRYRRASERVDSKTKKKLYHKQSKFAMHPARATSLCSECIRTEIPRMASSVESHNFHGDIEEAKRHWGSLLCPSDTTKKRKRSPESQDEIVVSQDDEIESEEV